MEYLTTLLEGTSFPLFTAFLLGLMTAISPCPLATNITAIGFISKDIESRNKVFFNGLIYTLGRAISYSGLAIIIYFGADQFSVSGIFQQYGEKFIGPLLVIIGLLMLDVVSIRFPGLGKLSSYFEKNNSKSYWNALLLGMVFALAFCPYSGVLYFGMLIPMTIGSASGLYLPFIFAVATGIPVIIFAYLLAFTLSGVGSFYHKMKAFELWFRRIISVLFIIVGIYYIVVMFF